MVRKRLFHYVIVISRLVELLILSNLKDRLTHAMWSKLWLWIKAYSVAIINNVFSAMLNFHGTVYVYQDFLTNIQDKEQKC